MRYEKNHWESLCELSDNARRVNGNDHQMILVFFPLIYLQV